MGHLKTAERVGDVWAHALACTGAEHTEIKNEVVRQGRGGRREEREALKFRRARATPGGLA